MILYIFYNYFLPAYKAGGPIRSIANLVNVIKDEVQVNVLCENKDFGGEVLPVEADKWVEQQRVRIYYSSSGFKGLRERIGGSKKVYFINGLYSLQFNLLPLLLLNGRKIVSVRGMLHPGALSQKRFKKKVYLSVWKILFLHRRCEYHVTSTEEKRYVQQVFGERTRIWLIPNIPHVLSYRKMPPKRPGQLVLVSLALISPMKNYLLVLKALSSCKAEITYHIYGPVKDRLYWETCKSVISTLPENITVIYHGEIHPDLVPEVLANSHVFVQPSESENFGHSLYEALTCGRPTITSFFTPWNELEKNQAGKNVSISGVQELIAAIEFFSQMSNENLIVWSNTARNYALRAIDVDGLKDEYLQMFMAESNN